MISRTKIIEHYKKHFMFPDNETLSEDYMIDIDWAESLISDLVEKQANGAESKDGKLPIPHVRQLLIDFCEIYAEGQFEDPDDTEGIVDWYLKVKDN